MYAEKLAEEKLQAENGGREGISVSNATATSKESAVAFKQQVKANQQRLKDAKEHELAILMTEREKRLQEDVGRLFRESFWIMANHTFPNGLPLNSQHVEKVKCYETFLSVLMQQKM